MSIHRLPLSLKEAITLADADYDYASSDLELFPNEPIRRTRLSDLLAEMASKDESLPSDQNLARIQADDSVVCDPSDPSRYLPRADRDPFLGEVGDQVYLLKSFLSQNRRQWYDSNPKIKTEDLRYPSFTGLPCHHSPEEFLRQASPVPPSSVTPVGYFERVFRPGEKVFLTNNRRLPGYVYSVGEEVSESIQPSEDGLLFCANPVGYSVTRKSTQPSRQSITHFRHFPFRLRWSGEQSLRLLMLLPLQILSVTWDRDCSVHVVLLIPSRTNGEFEWQRRNLAANLVGLGAFPLNILPTSLTMVPQFHCGDRMQELLYLNPAPDCRPIYPGVGDLQQVEVNNG